MSVVNVEEHRELVPALRNGGVDVVVIHGEADIAFPIAAHIRSEWSHVGIIVIAPCAPSGANYLVGVDVFISGDVEAETLAAAAHSLAMNVHARSTQCAEIEELRSRVNFSRLAVHDLANILTRVMYSSEALSLQPHELMSDGFESLNASISFSVDLLAHWRSLVNGEQVEPGPMDAGQAEAECFKMLCKSLPNGMLSLRVDGGGSFVVHGVPVDLGRMVINLVTNAYQAVDRKTGRIEIVVSRERGLAVVSVTDNGSGIAEEFLPLIFDQGFSTKKKFGGSGVGLFFSRDVLRSWGGDLEVATGSGRTVFKATLPILVTATLSDVVCLRGEAGAVHVTASATA
jgi:signal transduction histidine kinase